MAKPDRFKEYSTVNVIAATIAALAFHRKTALTLNPKFDYNNDSVKPTKDTWINLPKKADGSWESFQLSAASQYIRITLTGEKEKFMGDDVCEVGVFPEHRAEAAEVLEFVKGQVVMNVLKGKEYTGFMASVIEAIDSDTATLRNVGLLAYVPGVAKRMKSDQDSDMAKRAFTGSRAIGLVGDKVKVELTIIESRTLAQYDSVVYEAHDAQNNLFSFFVNAAKANYEIGETYSLSARIKAAGTNDYSKGVIVNSLNYVKQVA